MLYFRHRIEKVVLGAAIVTVRKTAGRVDVAGPFSQDPLLSAQVEPHPLCEPNGIVTRDVHLVSTSG